MNAIPDAPFPDDETWQRLHPLTPLLRGGRVLLVLAAIVGQQSLQREALDPAASGSIAVLVTGGAVFFGWLSWRHTRWRVTDTELQVDSGVLQRRNRRVPLARLESVDVVRPLVARVLGLAELRLEVVGSGEAEAPLAYLGEQQAHEVRSLLLDRAAGRSRDEARPVRTERTLIEVPGRALAASLLLSPVTAVVAGMVVGGLALTLLSPQAGVAALGFAVPAAIGAVGFVVRRFLMEFSWRVSENEDGVRLQHGLLETRSSTIPMGRVQAVRLEQPLLWRRAGWARAEA
ncbi:MAG TPA: PH domain-containing protein, partial [Mycobacteriales bacterium]|nr:PH domain-containing protein [Mycobacteriales bacterium]